jgi:hypothetical protein
MDREDYFLSEMEKRGIYIDFNLLVGRPFTEADGVRDAKLLHEGAKGTSFFDARLIELQKEYARQLLTHVNPYTRLSYADDPAVAIVEINNENAIDVGYHAPSKFYEDELVGLYNHWLDAHRSAAQIAKLRQICGVGSDAEVPLMNKRGESAKSLPERFHTEAEFYDDLIQLQRPSYRMQTMYPRQLHRSLPKRLWQPSPMRLRASKLIKPSL